MNLLPLFVLLAATPALADACDEAAQRIATEVGDAYVIRTGPIITVRRGRETFHYTVTCEGERASMISGVAGFGTNVVAFQRLLVRATNIALDVPESAALSAVDKCARLAYPHGWDGAETTDDALAVSCMVMHDAEEFEIRRR